ncbi:MAG TPA: sigma-70 family RNA polymerase sigma factor [Opitutaceae bacterium]|nr:sigma-70 family RNA polymerase sigma factor [Opitutaceae bacterium]
MQDDTELLRRYVEEHSGAAFAELVQRHLGLVYSTALRRVGGDTQWAEDVAQIVFTNLARKAHTLRNRASLSGWLYTSAQLASAAVVRSEQRRKARESTASTMENILSPQDPAADWSKIRPVLDDAMSHLREEDREAVLLRFFQQRSFGEIGATLRLTDDAARKRVDRALEELRSALAKYGIVSTAAALGTALSAATVASPTSLGPAVTQAALQSAAGSALPVGGAAIKAALPLAAAVALGGWLVLHQHTVNTALRAEVNHVTAARQETARLRAQNDDLRRQGAEVERLRREAQALPRLQAQVEVAAERTAPNPATVTITAAGTIRWGDRMVTLSRFLYELKTLSAASPDDAALVIRSEGAQFSAFAYAVDEARKIGISHVVVQRDGPADPKLGFSWF